jgi:hypothetical protein
MAGAHEAKGARLMWFKWLLVGVLSAGALLTVVDVGKPRKPISGGGAATTVAVTAYLVAGLLYYWR